jgi:hypothetical protein
MPDDSGHNEDGIGQCQIPWCDERQEFDSDEARCLHHSLKWYFFWTPLAEFEPIQPVHQDTDRSGGNE